MGEEYKKKYKLAILKSDTYSIYNNWIDAINGSNYDIEYKLIDIDSELWLHHILSTNFDIILCSPIFLVPSSKSMMDERLFFISNILKIKTYPDLNSFLVWENKRMLNYFLNTHKIPTPKTRGFSKRQEAIEFADTTSYPIVAKTITGASGLGVKILNNRNDAIKYIKSAFGKGISPKSGPDFRKPQILKRILKGIQNRQYLKNKISNYKSVFHERQIGYVYFQDFIPHTYEWRCVRIDNSYFAHKKMVKNNMASGSLLKEYGCPSEKLLDFIKKTSDILHITSAAYDIFETVDGEFLVNEVQTFFGQSDPHQMIIGGKPGRFVLEGEKWVFEEGDFNENKSYMLRLKHAIKIIDSQ